MESCVKISMPSCDNLQKFNSCYKSNSCNQWSFLASLNFPIRFCRKNVWQKFNSCQNVSSYSMYILLYYCLELSCPVNFFQQSPHFRLLSKWWTIFICLITLSSLLNLFKQYLHALLLSPSILSLSQHGTNIKKKSNGL